MISVTILTKNSERFLAQVLRPLYPFPEVVILDTGSTDHTLDIAKTFPNVAIYQRPFEGFGPTHNVASMLAKNDWILSIDSDEVMTDSLQQEVLALSLDNHCVYSMWRKNYYHGRHIKGCGWYPDRVVRLYHRSSTRFCNAMVHESIIATGLKVTPLSFPVIHYPYHSVSSFLRKMDLYTDLYADQKAGKKVSIFTAFCHASYAFLKSYLLQRGFLLGAEGFEIAWFNMNCAFYKYAKLAERSKGSTSR
jgi:glycosyltransferase involved in cell wall biosynthesis